jgi:hypothetical protein
MNAAENSASARVGLDSLNRGYLITPNPGEFRDHSDLVTFEGSDREWKEFQERMNSEGLKGEEMPSNGIRPFNFSDPDLREDFYAIPTLHPEIDTVNSYKDLLHVEAEHQRTLEDAVKGKGFGETLSKVNETAERVKKSPHNTITDWQDLLEENGKNVHEYPIDFDQKAKLFHRVTDNVPVNNSHRREKVGTLADSLNKLEDSELSQITGYLETDNHQLADTLFNISQARYSDFVEDEPEQIRNIIPTGEKLENQEIPEPPEIFEDDSPYREAVEEVYEELEEDIKEASYLADLQDTELQPDISVLKKWEAERQGKWDAGLDEDRHEEKAEKLTRDAKREIRKQLDNLQREYTKHRMEKIGSEAVETLYKDITGESKSIEEIEENEDLIYALRLRKHIGGLYNEEISADRRGTKVENLDRVIRNHDRPEEVYLLDSGVEESNREWVESQKYGLGDLIDPDLEEFLGDSGFENSESSRSSFTTYVEEAGEELTYTIADPLESLGMGRFADSCRAIGESRTRAAVHDSVAPNRLTVYVEDEKQQRKARIKAAITEDERLVYKRKSGQNDLRVELEIETEKYIDAVASNLGLDLEYNEDNDNVKDRVELLSSENFYWD